MATPNNGVKIEDDVKPLSEIGSPAAFVDDDEDTGELQFPKEYKQWWLTRLPKELWSALDGIHDDDEIVLGQIKVWQRKDEKTGQDNSKLRLTLNHDMKDFQYIPKEYDLRIVSQHVTNKFVFSEKNLPGYQPMPFGRSRLDRRNQDQLRKADPRFGGSRVERPWRRGARTIPKRTSFFGVPDHEVHCNPIENEEWNRLELLKARREGEKLAERRENLVHPDSQLDLHNASIGITLDKESRNRFEKFISIGGVEKKRPQENKAARIDRTDLVNLLTQKFKEYKFWSMGSLKAEINQPEAWLREVLSSIATLVKTGAAANTWTLQQQFAAAVDMEFDDAKQEEIAPGAPGESDVGEDDFDDNQEMEDVA